MTKNPFVEHVAGIITEQLMVPGSIPGLVLADLEEQNNGEGFTIDICHGHEGENRWTRHEKIRLPETVWREAVSLALKWAGLMDTRGEVIRLRVTASEKYQITRAAQEAGQTLSEYIRGKVFTRRIPIYERLTRLAKEGVE